MSINKLATDFTINLFIFILLAVIAFLFIKTNIKIKTIRLYYVFFTVPAEKLTLAISLLTQSGLINIDEATYMFTPANPDVDLINQ